jgi:long-chain acyl-CoA synthetase
LNARAPDVVEGTGREEMMTGGNGFPAVSLAAAQKVLTGKGAPFEIEECVINGIPTRVWKDAPATFRDLFVKGRSFGNRTFAVYGDDRATYESFARAALAIATALQDAGLRKGDRVGLVMRNLPEWPAVFFGTVLIGGIITPLNAWWTGKELEFGLKDCGAKVAFVDRGGFERISRHLHNCQALERVFVCRHEGEISDPKVAKLATIVGEVSDWHRLPDRPLPDVSMAADDDATIFYTSGTTGKPRGAVGTHRNSLSNVVARGYSLALTRLRRGEDIPLPDPDAPQKAALLVVPLFHVTGCQATMCPAIALGAKLVFMHKWDPELAMGIIERERITSTGGVPAIAWQLLQHRAFQEHDLSSLESVLYGGAPAAPELVRQLTKKLPKSVPGTGWGMTETCATFTSLIAEDYCLRPQSCGAALPVGDMKIVDAGGKELPPGAVGELWVKGPNVVKGYWENPEANRQSFEDGWLKTGDIARLDEEGFCYIVDRAKDMLIRGGENIYCIEVENALYEHPCVVDAAVVAVPHQLLGEEPGAVVALKPGTAVGEDELRGFVGERLAAFKVPVRIMFSEAPLPRNANGKLLKGELKSLFLQTAG